MKTARDSQKEEKLTKEHSHAVADRKKRPFARIPDDSAPPPSEAHKTCADFFTFSTPRALLLPLFMPESEFGPEPERDASEWIQRMMRMNERIK